MNYDSSPDTLAHIRRVQEILSEFAAALIRRGIVHDASKLGPQEKPVFDRETPALRELTYGSQEYVASLSRLGEALSHHYAHNSHHPEHYPNGIRDMDLFDVMEMFADWKAAGERDKDGSIARSIHTGCDRYCIEPTLKRIFMNTARNLGWLEASGS